jgi:conjugal transfer pilus assembly protein TraD
MFGAPSSPSPAQSAPPTVALSSQARDETLVLGALALALVVAFPVAIAFAGALAVLRNRSRRLASWLAALAGGLWLLADGIRHWGQHWAAVAASVVHGLAGAHHSAPWGGYLAAGIPAGLLVAGLGTVLISLFSGRLQPNAVERRPRTPGIMRRRLTKRQISRHPIKHLDRATLGIGPTGGRSELSDAEANGHALIVGATNSGKTVTQMTILCSAVARGIAVVHIDMKGGTGPASTLAAAAQRYGRPFTWVTLSGPTHYNPLARGDYSERMSMLIGSEQWSEPHYQRQAARQLQMVLQALDDPAIRRPDGTWLSDVIAALSPSVMKSMAVQVSSPHLRESLALLASTTRKDPGALGGLVGRLALLAESSAGRWMCRPSAGAPCFDLARAIDDGGVVVFSLDSSAHADTAAQFGAFVVQDLKAIAGLRLARGPQDPVYIGVDEFSALAGPQLTGLVVRGREAGMCVVLATQELADLTVVSPAFCDQVLGNTNVKIVHRQDVAESAERLAATMGTDRAWDLSLSQANAPGLFGGRRNRNFTWYPTARAVIDPADLLRLPQGVAMVVTKQPSIRVERVEIVPSRLQPVELPSRNGFPPAAFG